MHQITLDDDTGAQTMPIMNMRMPKGGAPARTGALIRALSQGRAVRAGAALILLASPSAVSAQIALQKIVTD